MEFSSKLLSDVVDEISRLPGIGKRSALRLALYLLKQPKENTLYATQGFDGQYIVIDFENNMIIGRNSLYYPMLDLSSERKMKISFEGSNYTATLPAGVGLFDNSNFWHQYYLYLINQAIE